MKGFKVSGNTTSLSTIITLTAIVIMYIICNIPRLIVNLFEHLLQDDKTENNLDLCGCQKPPKWLSILCSISHFLLTFNSSANFIIYFPTERNFNRVLGNLRNKIKRTKSVRSDVIEWRSEALENTDITEIRAVKDHGIEMSEKTLRQNGSCLSIQAEYTVIENFSGQEDSLCQIHCNESQESKNVPIVIKQA